MSHKHDPRVETLRSRLLSSELDLLAAIAEGDAALDNFNKQFEELLCEFEELRSIGLADDLLDSANLASHRVAFFSQLFVDLDDEIHTLESATVEEIDSIFADLSISARCPKDPTSASVRSIQAVRIHPNSLHASAPIFPY